MYATPARASTITRNQGSSRKLKLVPSKSRPVSPRASAPASRAGRKGRTPLAPESPAPLAVANEKPIAPGLWREASGKGVDVDGGIKTKPAGALTARRPGRHPGP